MKVAITGLGVVSSLGNSVDAIFARTLAGESAVKAFPEWRKLKGLQSFVGAPAWDYDISSIPRTARRSMSRMSEMAVVATLQALAQSGLKLDGSNHRTSLVLGSTSGSPETLENYFKRYIERGGPEGQLSTSFFKVMNHSIASNVALALNYLGPQLGVSSACSTSSQAMALGWELIQSGLYDVVVTGGADELHPVTAAVFDIVEAASRQYNDTPELTPRPFDRQRDGLVVSEGASIVILESEAHAKSRGANVVGWLEGAAYLCDGTHMSQPRRPSMIATMEHALRRAGCPASAIGYINAHATGTRLGDVEEGTAIHGLFGDTTPVSSLKGHFGHSMAACGGIEAILTLESMRRGLVLPTRNLQEADPECGPICLPKVPEERRVGRAMSNNFAFGGMNTALVLSIA